MYNIQLSIALATYNGERFLQEQLDSLLRQTLLPQELVVCDDGSTDATVSILEAFATEAPFSVQIHRNERNLGHGDTFLKAAMLCEGNWIAFCDQDDVWLENKLARYAEVIIEHPEVVLVSHSSEQVDADLRPLPHRIPDHGSFSVAGPLNNPPLGVLPGFTCCVRKDLIKSLPINERPEDMHRPGRRQSHDLFIYHVADAYGHIARVPESLALYRRHEMAVTGSNGTPIYDRSLGARLRAGAYAREEGFRHMTDQARQHQGFYLRVLGPSSQHQYGDEFVRRTRDAVEHYRRTADAYEIRAGMYSDQGGPIERARLLARNLGRGAYTGSSAGRGLGWKALTKDLVRVVVSW
jgi:glycosyltransferase involved in cell wall biosynthesis